jgi:hypothetical protein
MKRAAEIGAKVVQLPLKRYLFSKNKNWRITLSDGTQPAHICELKC